MAEERRDLTKFIDDGFDPVIFGKLTDASLMPQFLQSPSVRAHRDAVMTILRVHGINERLVQEIIPDLIAIQIAPGAKGAIRGNEFNSIIFEIVSHHCRESCDIGRECCPAGIVVDEIPDWWVLHRKTARIIIGYNQIDLWSGGAQCNRAAKYLKMKIPGAHHLCVVCDKPRIGRATSKKYGIVKLGMTSGLMCFPRQLCAKLDCLLSTK